eukprot:1404554-Lingulodinium_polyedra.AAC.1
MVLEGIHDLRLADLHGGRELSQGPGVHDFNGLEDGLFADRLPSDLPVEGAATNKADVLVNGT